MLLQFIDVIADIHWCTNICISSTGKNL